MNGMIQTRVTRQRTVILEELRKLTCHPTADELCDIVRRRLPHTVSVRFTETSTIWLRKALFCVSTWLGSRSAMMATYSPISTSAASTAAAWLMCIRPTGRRPASKVSKPPAFPVSSTPASNSTASAMSARPDWPRRCPEISSSAQILLIHTLTCNPEGEMYV